MKVIEYLLDESEESGVFAISVVSAGAIESDFVMLAKEDVNLKLIDERGILLGAALIPEKPILRRDKDGEEYHIFFSKETIRKVSEKFLEQDNHKQTTLEHAVPMKGNLIVETWIKESEIDKSVHFGIEAPVGTWFISMKVSDPKVLELAREGHLNGFSIEGMFSDKVVMQSEEELYNEIMDLISKI
jgi:hypothetical protein